MLKKTLTMKTMKMIMKQVWRNSVAAQTWERAPEGEWPAPTEQTPSHCAWWPDEKDLHRFKREEKRSKKKEGIEWEEVEENVKTCIHLKQSSEFASSLFTIQSVSVQKWWNEKRRLKTMKRTTKAATKETKKWNRKERRGGQKKKRKEKMQKRSGKPRIKEVRTKMSRMRKKAPWKISRTKNLKNPKRKERWLRWRQMKMKTKTKTNESGKAKIDRKM